MTPIYKIEEHSVHLWHVFLPDLLAEIPYFSTYLNEDEIARARQFRFDEHRERFIIARAILRQLAGLYIGILPQDIVLTLGDRGKPFLQHNPVDLQFNLSHSHDRAVYAFTTHAEIGIDIEKMESNFNLDVAKRFFSEKEYAALCALSEPKRTEGFYRLWVAREALIKALGAGLYSPLTDFSVDLSAHIQTIKLIYHDEMHHYHLQAVPIHADYPCAFATRQTIREMVCREWTIDY